MNRVVFCTDERYLDHVHPGAHPESPDRVHAVNEALISRDLSPHLIPITPAAAADDILLSVHTPDYLARLRAMSGQSGGHFDPDTWCGPRSPEVARLAVGGLLDTIQAIENTQALAGFAAVRPPGHHARPHAGMGFCLLNAVAVATRTLIERGERVLVADIDAHHGNGTQEALWNEPRAMFISWHQSPGYPGSGSASERGGPAALGLTHNIEMAPGSDLTRYRVHDDAAITAIEDFKPTYLLISAGFDAHRDDPITDLGLAAADFSHFARILCPRVGPGKVAAVLEGGYDLTALADSVYHFVSTLIEPGTYRD